MSATPPPYDFGPVFFWGGVLLAVCVVAFVIAVIYSYLRRRR